MENQTFTNVRKLTTSGIVIALYVVILFMTQSFSFGAYQIRIVTSLYALSYLFPFLVIPLGLANFIANMLGGFGIIDMVGGFIVGIVTSGIVMLIKKFHLPRFMIFFPITLVPGLGVALWLSPMVHMPYGALALSLCIGGYENDWKKRKRTGRRQPFGKPNQCIQGRLCSGSPGNFSQ